VDTEPDCGASLVICRLTGRGRTDDRFLSSIAQGLRPAKSHEKPLGYASACQPAGRPGFFDPVGMGVPPAKLHEKPAKANKWGTRSEHAAGFFDPVAWPPFRFAIFHENLVPEVGRSLPAPAVLLPVL
jgi:hypothetical protein